MTSLDNTVVASNSIGNIIRVTSFGESHGSGGVGVVIDGFPANFEVDIAYIQKQLGRRRPGQSELTTSRNESDQLEVLSGLYEGRTTGHPITFLIRNKDSRSKDYDHLKEVYRPSHADYTYESKYGLRDHRGGGRASARITAGWVAAGALCDQWLKEVGIDIVACVRQVAGINADLPPIIDRAMVDQNAVRCPDPDSAKQMNDLIAQMKEEGDSVGGVITCMLYGVPKGLGDPVFQKLHANLGQAMFSINAVKGVEFGGGFDMVKKKGSEVNDGFRSKDGEVSTTSNFSGGIQGGISNGEIIQFNIAFKPTATVSAPQETVDRSGKKVELSSQGRHDPCVLPRAVPIVESMAAIVVADHLLMHRSSKI